MPSEAAPLVLVVVCFMTLAGLILLQARRLSVKATQSLCDSPLTGLRVRYFPRPDSARTLAPSPDAASGFGDRVEAVNIARASGTVALIRPDAYIAWAAAGNAATPSHPPLAGALVRKPGPPGSADSRPINKQC